VSIKCFKITPSRGTCLCILRTDGKAFRDHF
jgi:hypothetical protein